MYKNINQVIAANKASGLCWFDSKTMKFFNTTIESGVIKGKFFITSERMELDMPKEYSIRVITEDSKIHTVANRGQFKSVTEAIEHLNSISE
mgnify:CR=1 FL=1